MREAASALLGEHDFSAFRAKNCAAKSPVRTMEHLTIEEGDWPEATLRIRMEATGFLQHMARIVAGTLVAVGHGRLKPERVAAILAGRRREDAGQTAPGWGLYLLHVRYDLEIFPELAPLLGGQDSAK
jgi:tRNA pseudouridine38-40 synthase